MFLSRAPFAFALATVLVIGRGGPDGRAAVPPPPAASAVRPEDTPAIEEPAPATDQPAATEAAPAAPGAAPEAPPLPPVKDWLEAQVELSRRGFSCGSIDGVGGPQTVAALKAFQQNEGLRDTGKLDQATKEVLLLTAPAFTQYAVTTVDAASVHPVPDSWLDKSNLPALDYASVLELVAEKHHASPNFVRRLNPDVDWKSILPGVTVKVPAVDRFTTTAKLVRLHISLSDHVLEGVDENARTIFHFPVSIARKVEKRPVGELHVTVVIPNPVYTWDPELFPESPESKVLTHKLILPAGPNNPVGLAWIGLDLQGYGIHGTPEPENVGRTESHGCFRLANWDAVALLDLVWTGLPLDVDP
jgi:lipoprotein-anchoring transpeptidase ErfK/SrfK